MSVSEEVTRLKLDIECLHSQIQEKVAKIDQIQANCEHRDVEMHHSGSWFDKICNQCGKLIAFASSPDSPYMDEHIGG